MAIKVIIIKKKIYVIVFNCGNNKKSEPGFFGFYDYLDLIRIWQSIWIS
jgi:hypothetical protein